LDEEIRLCPIAHAFLGDGSRIPGKGIPAFSWNDMWSNFVVPADEIQKATILDGIKFYRLREFLKSALK